MLAREYGVIIFNDGNVFIGQKVTFFDESGFYFAIPDSDEPFTHGNNARDVKSFIPIPFFDDLIFIITRDQNELKDSDVTAFMDDVLQKICQDMAKNINRIKKGEKQDDR